MHSDSPFCHNCGIRLTGPFCAACGQKAVPLTVTLHDFFHELTHEMLHLTRDYVQGRRARWISPIRLYLIFSVVFFGLSALTGFRVGLNDSPQAQRGGGLVAYLIAYVAAFSAIVLPVMFRQMLSKTT